MEEGFAAGEVDFAHAGLLEEEHGALGVFEGFDVGGCCGVEAETWWYGKLSSSKTEGWISGGYDERQL